MKRYLSALIGMVMASTMMAAPALPIPFSITLSNGRVVTVTKCGDEHGHWLQTENGDMVIKNAAQEYVIATEVQRDSVWTERTNTIMKAKRQVERIGSSFPTHGEMHSLVILVNFTNKQFMSETAQQDFDRMMNDQGYSENGATGSARDYYIENSMGAFVPHFDVVGPINMANEYGYYGANRNGKDALAAQMIIEACRAADEIVDFSDYDYNNDGFIDNVFVFYAGGGENWSDDEDAIWPHSWDITKYQREPVMLDGKQLNHYACTNEVSIEGVMDGIGTFVHEFGHVLGLPDFYPTAYTTAFTPGKWSVMDLGEYNNSSRTPPYFTAFERYCLGWLSPLELEEAASVSLEDISSNKGCIIASRNSNEFFMLENRQQKGWDAALPGHGMLVWHIDYNKKRWADNTVNNDPLHQYVDVVEADNIRSAETIDGDVFPGKANITAFTAQTTPALMDWSGHNIDVPLTNIREEDGIIYFDVCGGGDPLEPIRYVVPLAFDATAVNGTSFMANWMAVEDAENYEVHVGQMVKGDEKTETIDFYGGVDVLPDWWTTDVTTIYNNASYSGEASPSLRLQAEGNFIECEHDDIHSIQFWCRGSSVVEGTTVEVLWSNKESGKEMTESFELSSEKTTRTFRPADKSKIWNKVAIIYHPELGSGSLALDDIVVTFTDEEFHSVMNPITTANTSVQVTGLSLDTDYCYYVVAQQGSMHSKQSNMVKVHTATVDGIEEVYFNDNDNRITAKTQNQSFTLTGQRASKDYRGIIIRNGRKVIKR